MAGAPEADPAENAPTPEQAAARALALMREEGLSPSAAAKAAAQGTPYGKSEIYKLLLALQEQDSGAE